MRILVIGSDNPAPPINGTRIRNFHLWPHLRNLGHEVKFLAITRNPEDLKLSNDDCEFFLFTKKSLLKRVWMRLFHSYHEWPVSDSLEARVAELQSDWKPDVIHAEELRMGRYLPQKSQAPTILLSLCVHNVESTLIKKTLAAPFSVGVHFFNKIYHRNLLRFEEKVLKNADLRLTYSEEDRKSYQRLYPQLSFKASSNGVNFVNLSDQEQHDPGAQNILFLGSLSYLPNIEGLFWFLDSVLPLVKSSVRLTVAGSTPAQVVRDRLQKDSIPLLDTPLELRPIYLENSVLLVPLLSGSGTRGKILEALMYHRSVLTTTKGVEGLNLGADAGVIVADGEVEFAQALDRWISLPGPERLKFSSAGRAAVLEHYTWDKVGGQLLNFWSELRDRPLRTLEKE